MSRLATRGSRGRNTLLPDDRGRATTTVSEPAFAANVRGGIAGRKPLPANRKTRLAGERNPVRSMTLRTGRREPRTERDSNPRYAFTYTRFPGVRLQPLGHLSNCKSQLQNHRQKTKPPSRCVTAARKNGQGEIRTLDTLAGMPVFETGAFNRSATCPDRGGEPPIPQPSNIASQHGPVNEASTHLSTCKDGPLPWTRRNRLSRLSRKVPRNIWREVRWSWRANAWRTSALAPVTVCHQTF